MVSVARAASSWLVPVFVVLLLAGAGFGLARVDSGVVRTSTVVGGVPVDLVRPAAVAGSAPGVVVAHGHAASRRLMADWGTTLARSGFVVALPDFAGHGANPAPLPDEPERRARLAADLDAAVGLLRRTPGVDPERIGLVGHSMGAGAVHRYAAEHPGIAATVAVSLPGFDVPPDPALPADLLLLTGQFEFPVFHRAAEQALRAGRPDAVWGAPGHPARENARQGGTVAGAEHLTILFSPGAHARTAHWLQQSLHVSAPVRVAAGERLRPAALLWAAFAIGLLPFARRTFRSASPAPESEPGSAPSVPVVAGAAAAGLVLAVAGSALAPGGWSPLAVGGEIGLFLVLFGIGSRAVLRGRARRDRRVRSGRISPGRRPVAVTCYALLAVAVPIGIALAEPVPHGARRWWTPLLVLACGTACAAAEFAARGRTGASGDAVRAAVLVTALLGVGVSSVAGVLPSFVLLIAPLLGVLLLWHLAWAAVLTRAGAAWWLPAVVGGVLLGWPLAAVSPLG